MHLTRAARRTSITLLAALAILGTVVSAPPVNAAPPSNDDFDSPIEVTPCVHEHERHVRRDDGRR